MATTLGAIVEALGGELKGDAAQPIVTLAPLSSSAADALSFITHTRYLPDLATSAVAAVVASPALVGAVEAAGKAAIVTADPYLYFAHLTQWWKRTQRPAPEGERIHPSAVVDPAADVHPTARIGAHCVVERGVRIGADTVLMPRVFIGENCHLGARCTVFSGAVIGADGFGYAPERGRWQKIEQLGAVWIGDDVDIGANTCIDRGALVDTVIEDGVKLDNLIQIGHNCHIGKHTAIAGNTGVAGSCKIGAHCSIGGAANILGHLTIADHVYISVAAVVTRSILKPGLYTGHFPIDDNATWEKNAATLKQLSRLRERVKKLEQTEHTRDTTP